MVVVKCYYNNKGKIEIKMEKLLFIFFNERKTAHAKNPTELDDDIGDTDTKIEVWF